jgi:hypothetical protein
MQQVEQGALDLDADVNDYLVEVQIPGTDDAVPHEALPGAGVLARYRPCLDEAHREARSWHLNGMEAARS